MPTLIDEQKIISELEKIYFSVDKRGVYFIAILAKVKNEKQRGESQTDDEELLVQIDDLSFPKTTASDGLLNSPASFSGGTQHDEEKTIYFIIELFEGQHTLAFIPQHSAIITDVRYEPLQIISNQISLEINQQPADRKSTPWLTFVLINSNLIQATITAELWWHWRDGDDLQVRINREIIPNPSPLFNKNWIFRSRPIFDFFGRKQTEVFNVTPNNSQLHYIEIWADRKPLIEKISFDLDATISFPQLYPKIVKNEDYNRYDEIITEKTAYWNQYFAEQLYPPEKLDPSLVKAIVYIESRMGYYSAPEGFYPAYPDVMQIGDPRNPAIHALKNDDWISPITNKLAREYVWTPEGPKVMDYGNEIKIETEKDSIYWGVRWLFHLAEIIHEDGSRSWETWQKAVGRYNGGGDNEYLEKVFAIYTQGPKKA